MAIINQILALTKQELRSASRSRYIILSFILMPLVMWGVQGGVQLLIGGVITGSQEGQTIFVVNFDQGNGTYNLGEEFISALIAETQRNGSLLSGALIDNTTYVNSNYSTLMNLINNSKTAGDVTPIIIIPEGFTDKYTAYPVNGVPFIEVYSLPGGIVGSSILEAALFGIANSPPFTQVVVQKYVQLSPKTIVFEGEESAAFGFGAGFIGFLSVIIAVMAPAPFVSTSFAGEREKKTMESLLALPISRFNILIAKLLAGMALIGIFAVMNIFGLMLFSFILNFTVSNDVSDYASVFNIDLSITLVALIAITMFLSAFVSIGIGISVASLTKDVRSSESLYTLTMLIPSLIVGMTSMFGGLPDQAFGGAGILLYIIPWSHAIAILSKGLYPQTYASSTLTGSIPLDLGLHLGYLLVVILICLFISSKVFDREGILT